MSLFTANQYGFTRTTGRLLVRGSLYSYGFCIIFFIFISSALFAQQNQNTEASRREIIKYGTETEIASLIQALRSENINYLDDDLVTLVESTRNQRILTGVFGFFGERDKNGLEGRAMRAITEREDETNETILSAIEYLGRIKASVSVPVIKDLLDTEERRFLSSGFRAIGAASSSVSQLADETAEFLIDYYNYRNPGNDNQGIIIAAVGDTGSLLGIPFLSDIVTNPDSRLALRIAALNAISKIGDEGGLEAILSCVGANDPNVRSAAVRALGPFNGPSVDNAILDAFRDSYYQTRIAAAQASRDRKLEDAVPFLKFRAERDEVPNVRDEAIRALGAIANEEAIGVLESLFSEARNSDRVRILSCEMLMKNSGDRYFSKTVLELNDAKTRNQTNFYNSLLKIISEAVVTGNKTEIERVAHSFMQNGTIIEKLYGLDMAANNDLKSLSDLIITLARDRNESLARRARGTAERLGIEIPAE